MTATIDSQPQAGFEPAPVSSRIFVRCYRHYGEAKHAFDQLQVVARIPDTRMTVVARGLEWHEALPVGRLYKLACSLTAITGALVALALSAAGLTSAESDWFTLMLLAAAFGAALGFVGATVLARLRQRRDATMETGHVEPRQYDILVEEELAETAREALR